MRTLLVLLACLATQVAHAHARLVRSEPAEDAVLEIAPEELRLWFDAQVERRFHSFELRGPGCTGRALEAFVPEEADRKLLGVKLGDLQPGEWKVVWEVVSRDGHRVDGVISFEVKAP